MTEEYTTIKIRSKDRDFLEKIRDKLQFKTMAVVVERMLPLFKRPELLEELR